MPEPKDDRVVIDAPFCLGGEGGLVSVAGITQWFKLCYFKNHTAGQVQSQEFM